MTAIVKRKWNVGRLVMEHRIRYRTEGGTVHEPRRWTAEFPHLDESVSVDVEPR